LVNIQTTRWSPDTCDCVIVYEWDRDLDPSMRTHQVKQIDHACETHKPFTQLAIWNYVVNENLRKNDMINAMRSYLNTDLEKLDEQFQLTWRFEGPGDRRILHVSLPTLGSDQKVRAQKTADDLVGLGLVVVK